MFSFLGDLISPRPPRQGCGAAPVFRVSVDTLSPRPPFRLYGDGFLDVFVVPYGYASFLSLFGLAVLVSFVVSPFRGVGVGFEPHLRLIF